MLTYLEAVPRDEEIRAQALEGLLYAFMPVVMNRRHNGGCQWRRVRDEHTAFVKQQPINRGPIVHTLHSFLPNRFQRGVCGYGVTNVIKNGEPRAG